MQYLLDTNILVILIEKSLKRLSKAQETILMNPENEFFLSEASLFEISIKIRLGKTDFIKQSAEEIEAYRKSLGIKLLKSKVNYYTNIPNIPKVILSGSKIHSDPFDLLIISQALEEQIPILSTDRYFPLYEGLKVIQ